MLDLEFMSMSGIRLPIWMNVIGTSATITAQSMTDELNKLRFTQSEIDILESRLKMVPELSLRDISSLKDLSLPAATLKIDDLILSRTNLREFDEQVNIQFSTDGQVYINEQPGIPKLDTPQIPTPDVTIPMFPTLPQLGDLKLPPLSEAPTRPELPFEPKAPDISGGFRVQPGTTGLPDLDEYEVVLHYYAFSDRKIVEARTLPKAIGKALAASTEEDKPTEIDAKRISS